MALRASCCYPLRSGELPGGNLPEGAWTPAPSPLGMLIVDHLEDERAWRSEMSWFLPVYPGY